MNYYLAVDIGASGGRHLLGWVENDTLHLEEVYRFENDLVRQGDALIWDIDRLRREVINGIAACKNIGKLPATVAIDTWGVDYVLLDEECKPLLPVHCYRDPRTAAVIDLVHQTVSEEELYARTGIQFQTFNTVYQLACDRQTGKLAKARHFLMMPEYLAYCLSGVMANEYTNATTGALVNCSTRRWDYELMDKLGIPTDIFEPLSQPGRVLGGFTPEVREQVGFDAQVVLCAGHDTACAVAACPLSESGLYISSGTWSLMGAELNAPTLTREARLAGFTNEGGVHYRYRFLKNIMGMWLLQNIRRNIGKTLSYDEMMELARQSTYDRLIDTNDPAFVAPEDMVLAIRTALGEPELPLGDVLGCVYRSLAHTYAQTVRDIEAVTGTTVSDILIVGGGGFNTYLNELTEELSGKPVRVGLTEATASGNLGIQHMAVTGCTLTRYREIIQNTFMRP